MFSNPVPERCHEFAALSVVGGVLDGCGTFVVIDDASTGPASWRR
jgi:hypothetical protein